MLMDITKSLLNSAQVKIVVCKLDNTKLANTLVPQHAALRPVSNPLSLTITPLFKCIRLGEVFLLNQGQVSLNTYSVCGGWLRYELYIYGLGSRSKCQGLGLGQSLSLNPH